MTICITELDLYDKEPSPLATSPNDGRYVTIPRIFGDYPNSTSIHNLYYYNDGPEIQGGAAVMRHSNYIAFDPSPTTTKASFGVVNFDLSRSSSLYQNGLTEVRVRSLFGLNLIRAF